MDSSRRPIWDRQQPLVGNRHRRSPAAGLRGCLVDDGGVAAAVVAAVAAAAVAAAAAAAAGVCYRDYPHH